VGRRTMSLGGGEEAGKDPEIARLLQIEQQKARFHANVHRFTGVCWTKCMDKPGPKLDARTETCLKNCVERFLDTANFIVNRLGSLQEQ
jgi:import inner membrane translocase subunit TIM8